MGKKQRLKTLKLLVHIAVTAPGRVKYSPPHWDLESSLSIYFAKYNFMISQFCKSEVTNISLSNPSSFNGLKNTRWQVQNLNLLDVCYCLHVIVFPHISYPEILLTISFFRSFYILSFTHYFILLPYIVLNNKQHWIVVPPDATRYATKRVEASMWSTHKSLTPFLAMNTESFSSPKKRSPCVIWWLPVSNRREWEKRPRHSV